MVEGPTLSPRHVLFWALLAAQLIVPVIQLGELRPARFGWQMFSGVGRPAEFEVELSDGTVQPVDVGELLARPRPEMDLATTLPPRLCERIPGAVVLRVRGPADATLDGEVRCP